MTIKPCVHPSIPATVVPVPRPDLENTPPTFDPHRFPPLHTYFQAPASCQIIPEFTDLHHLVPSRSFPAVKFILSQYRAGNAILNFFRIASMDLRLLLDLPPVPIRSPLFFDAPHHEQ
jgi:hypothetical protein